MVLVGCVAAGALSAQPGGLVSLAGNTSEAKMDPTILRDKAMQVMEPHCYSCHGAEKQKGDVRFDALEAIDPVDLQKLLLDAKAAADGTIETFGPSVLSKDD